MVKEDSAFGKMPLGGTPKRLVDSMELDDSDSFDDYEKNAEGEVQEDEEEEAVFRETADGPHHPNATSKSPPCYGFGGEDHEMIGNGDPTIVSDKTNDLKIKIKFGKIVPSAINSDKIVKDETNKTKERRDTKDVDSDGESEMSVEIQLPGAPVTATLSEAEVSAESSPVCSPVGAMDDDAPFHGWHHSEIVSRRTETDYKKFDLSTPFFLKPSAIVSISSKKMSPEKFKKTVTAKLDAKSSFDTSSKSHPSIGLDSPSVILDKNNKKCKNPNLKYFRPLEAGWVREVVNRTENNVKKTDVSYWPPVVLGQKHKKFKSATELEGFLITSGSVFAASFFTFRKEPIGAPEGMEIIRELANNPNKSRDKVTPVKTANRLVQDGFDKPEVLGKRVSKKPEKLLLEMEKNEKVEKAEKSPAVKLSKSTTGSWKDPENIVKSPKKVVTTVSKSKPLPGLGLLKVKMFSKMKAKNQLSGSDGSKNNSEAEDNENHPPIEITPASDPLSDNSTKTSSITPSSSTTLARQTTPSMTVTKVKKSSAPPQSSHFSNRSSASQLGQLTQPSITIRPAIEIRPIGRSQNSTVSLPTVPARTDGGEQQPKIVRPTKTTQLPCSIHCPGVSGFPSLSCTTCHCLFHPKCVGLPAYLGNSSQVNFYCNDCQPEKRSKDQMSQPNSAPSSKSSHILKPPSVQPLLKTSSPSTRRKQDLLPRPNKVTTSNNKSDDAPPLKEPQKRPEASPPAPRPLEGQAMINIAGNKFLVIPHPAPVTIDSPPPSPPNREGGTGDKKGDTKCEKFNNQKLPVLLKPGPGSPKDLPSFEVEETADGQLILLPVGDAASKNLFGSRKRKIDKASTLSDTAPAAKTWCHQFTTNIAAGYFAMMQVFKYLTVRERLTAGSVCRLWRDLSYHYSLWETVSLKNTRVYDWRGFSRFLNKTKSSQLDLRKMLFVRDRDATWAEVITVASDLQHLTKLQLPRLSGSILSELVTTCPRLEVVNAPLTSPPVDLNVFAKMRHLRELRLKAGIGILKVENGTKNLEKLSATLKHLSLLTLEGLENADFDVFGTLHNLESLELGDCTSAPATLFKVLSELPKLERLRLEKGSVGDNISKLSRLEHLQTLELIDFQVELGFQEGLKTLSRITKFLLIPTYRNEVAAINAEIVEGVTQGMRHLKAFCLGVTNEWLEAMTEALGGGGGGKKAGGDKECFPITRGGRAELISLPALYRLICREMPETKVKVLKMSAQATCKQFISNLNLGTS